MRLFARESDAKSRKPEKSSLGQPRTECRSSNGLVSPLNHALAFYFADHEALKLKGAAILFCKDKQNKTKNTPRFWKVDQFIG